MERRFSKDSNFRNLLRRNKDAIVYAALNGLEATDNFKRMRSLIIAMSDKYSNNSFKYIVISEQDLQNLTHNADNAIELLFKAPLFIQNCHIIIDSNLEIKEVNNEQHNDNNETRRIFTQMSKKEGVVIFVVSPENIINYFVNGRDGGDSIFYESSTLRSFNCKKPISELESVLEEYREHLKLRNTYSKFFVEKSHLKSLRTDLKSELSEERFIKANKQLLRNTPEDCFRDDLRMFLKEKLKIFIGKEFMLESLKRLDITMIDEEGEGLYFIEVKWVGMSVHQSGKGKGTTYDAKPRIVPDAFKQSIAYIIELLAEEKNFKLGYLAVFDARGEDLPDTGEGMTIEQIPEEHRSVFYRLLKLKDFRVINEHPN